MKDKRTFDRVGAQQKVTCRILEGLSGLDKDCELTVRDIAPGGISFLNDGDIASGTLLKLEVKFPFTVAESVSAVMGKVAYCIKDAESLKYNIGISYVSKRWNYV